MGNDQRVIICTQTCHTFFVLIQSHPVETWSDWGGGLRAKSSHCSRCRMSSEKRHIRIVQKSLSPSASLDHERNRKSQKASQADSVILNPKFQFRSP